jgi:hypothetical protein
MLHQQEHPSIGRPVVFAGSSQLPTLGRTRTRVLLVASAVALVMLLLGANAQRADAACTHSAANGTWVNADPANAGIAQIQLMDCQSVAECYPSGACGIDWEAGWKMRVWAKCSPANCDWGWSAAALPVSGRAYGFYDQGFVKRYVYATMSSVRPGQLWVHWDTDFVDPSRADYSKDEWFVRA